MTTTSENLTFITASKLLQDLGYQIVERFEHIHAVTLNSISDERHICLFTDLPAMNANTFIAIVMDTFKTGSFVTKTPNW